MTSILAPICRGCKHLRGDLRSATCDAFPHGIPRDIMLSRVDHREPHDGDHGITFDPETPDDAAYADRLFTRSTA